MSGRLMVKRLAEAVTKKRFRELVLGAYAHEHGAEHCTIVSAARRWFDADTEERGLLPPDRFMDFVFQAQRKLHAEGESRDLGPAPGHRGFDDRVLLRNRIRRS